MIIQTKHFGDVEINEEDVLVFEYGIPGFDELTKFVILGKTDVESPFFWLQSLEDSGVAFVISDPFNYVSDYEAEIDTTMAKFLGIEDENDAIIYNIVTVPEDISKTSINLKAPLVINTKNNKGCQVILENEKYKFKHIIMEDFK